MNISEWLERTTAAGVMVTKVTALPPASTMAQAAGMLLSEQVSGAPVVDERGVCVGVLSASDVIAAEGKVAAEARAIAESSFWNSNLALPASVYADKLAEVRDKIAPAAQQAVERFMTKDIVSVSEETSLATVVQHMVNAHIHRVLVVDAENRLRGIVSTTDVLAALLRGNTE